MDPFHFPPPNEIFSNRPSLISAYQTGTRVLLPIPQISDPFQSIISDWESEISTRLNGKRNLLNSKKRMSLLDFKKKLSRWRTLLERPNNQSSVGELESLQQECTDSELLQIMKRKIERSCRRKRSRSEAPTVLRMGVGELLSRLDSNALPLKSECHLSEPLKFVKSPEDKQISEKYLEDLRKASRFCQEKLSILKKLDQLRNARIGQLRGQDRLIPQEIDNIFESRKASILNDLESAQMTINKLTIRIKNTQRKLVSQSTGITVDSISTDEIIPMGLPSSVRYALFGSFNYGGSTKWIKFYSQCNRNFSDFLRIRHNFV
ncbi:unnamed protein product [Hymenolepis diminuta]|uniref:Uncharacterized protein n=1 Tax=Hymenolepis diminuta TaxID=6216 RepID=A0A564YAK9_HYMDI|nr:unnamed protein product [Hymenolepis diminuta]